MLAKTDVIDLIARGSDGYWLTLVVEAGEWEQPEALPLLQAKVYTAADYIDGGQLFSDYPDAKGQPVTIQLRHVDPVPSSVQRLIDSLSAYLADEGHKFVVEPLIMDRAA